MSELLRREIRQSRPFGSREEEVVVELERTAAVFDQALLHFLRRWELTPTQYNVLRILRGARPDDLPCREVGHRMVTTVPDVTRLLDRLEARGWVSRRRDPDDRRVVRVGITDEGLEIVDGIDSPLREFLSGLFAEMDSSRVEALEEALASARASALKALADADGQAARAGPDRTRLDEGKIER